MHKHVGMCTRKKLLQSRNYFENLTRMKHTLKTRSEAKCEYGRMTTRPSMYVHYQTIKMARHANFVRIYISVEA
jgi:hypothetical protein